jgi:cyclic-di-GMP phosphodiesterase TipF (flagellum assembly factor)
MRLGAAFVTVCMLLIAGSAGAVLYITFAFPKTDAAVVGVALLSGLALINAATTRERDRSEAGDKIADLARGTADLARQVGDIARRMTALETEIGKNGDRSLAIVEPILTEVEMLGGLVKQLADSVNAHETALVGFSAQARLAAASPAAASPLDVAPSPEAGASGGAGIGGAEVGRFKGMPHEEVRELIQRALETNRIELYVQPIVTLPQRKVRYYEGLARLRTVHGELILPADFLADAEQGGLMPAIDNLVLFRCVQVVRRLQAKKRDIGLFCNVSAASLSDPRFFPEFSEFMQANRALTSSLVFEFAQATVRAMGPLDHESLASLADLGFRFSLDHVTDLRMEPRELADRGFRFVKVPAAMLLSRVTPATDIHPADFSDLLGRFGIDLIAEKIESETTAVDLLDFDVRFGQGFLFSPPRPVRGEALEPATGAGAPRAPASVDAPKSAPSAAPAVPPAAATEPPTTNPPFPNPPFPGRRGGALSQLARGVVRRA